MLAHVHSFSWTSPWFLGLHAMVPALQEPEPVCRSFPLHCERFYISSGPKRRKQEAMTAHPTVGKLSNSAEVASRLSPVALATATQTETRLATAESEHICGREGVDAVTQEGLWLAAQWKRTKKNLPNVTKALAKPQFKLWAENRACTSVSITTSPSLHMHRSREVSTLWEKGGWMTGLLCNKVLIHRKRNWGMQQLSFIHQPSWSGVAPSSWWTACPKPPVPPQSSDAHRGLHDPH